jgi:hypothetical protein
MQNNKSFQCSSKILLSQISNVLLQVKWSIIRTPQRTNMIDNISKFRLNAIIANYIRTLLPKLLGDVQHAKKSKKKILSSVGNAFRTTMAQEVSYLMGNSKKILVTVRSNQKDSICMRKICLRWSRKKSGPIKIIKNETKTCIKSLSNRICLNFQKNRRKTFLNCKKVLSISLKQSAIWEIRAFFTNQNSQKQLAKNSMRHK